ncbi:helicase-related protein [Thermococcus camini]|uniref:Helicase domain protein n=1 Tax=Thermococcus camini TaxID=2016373 RepID=A0A7G2DA57_9EURY|nr:helicase-related protein [Thermococcus camini]CAD5245186.1 Helicase domain protein [Thermococcus camini]
MVMKITGEIKVIDNTKKPLSEYIKKELLKSRNAKFAVGYFYLSGWNLINDGVPSAAPKDFLKLVIGNSPDIDAGISKDEFKLRFLEEISKHSNSDTVENLCNLIRNEIVKIRAYTQGRLHSKLYLFTGDNRQVAIVGSSNLTSAGLFKNKELNIILQNVDTIKELDKWFEELWEESEDIQEEILELIEAGKNIGINFGKFVTPKQLFKILVWKWFDGMVEPVQKKGVLAEFQLIGVINAIRIISEFNGVIIADSVGLGKSFIGATIIEEYLRGKLPNWDPNRFGIKKERKALLILPPSLIPQWEYLLTSGEYFFSRSEGFYLKPISSGSARFRKYTIFHKTRGKVGEIAFLSMDKFSAYSQEDIINMGLNYDYDLILIDEAHRLRNRATKRWKNARVLRFKDKSISYQNKFILLTATPLNNTIWDIYNLIKVFSDDFFSAFKSKGIDITQLFMEFREAKKKWKEDPLKYEAQLQRIAQKIKEEVLDNTMILRTRKYILQTFGKDGKIKIGERELIFQDPKPDRVTYKEITGGQYQRYWEFIKTLPEYFEKLEFEYVNLYTSGYIILGSSPEETTPAQAEEEFVKVSLSSILKLLLAKRIESSIFAFERTLNKMYGKNHSIYTILKSYIPKLKVAKTDRAKFDKYVMNLGEDLLRVLQKEDVESKLLTELGEEPETYNTKLVILSKFVEKGAQIQLPEFKTTEELLHHVHRKHLEHALIRGMTSVSFKIKSDITVMKAILSKLEEVKVRKNGSNEPEVIGYLTEESEKIPIYNYYDPKLERLKEIIKTEFLRKKCIIFTQYKDTAKYLYAYLSYWAPNQAALQYLVRGDNQLKIGLVTGELDVEQKEHIIKRFAPIANNSRDVAERYGEIEILISTDSLSEGVNLQDADAVINYDLPWNPMIIVQRVGRVSRIGNEKEVIVKNFFPAEEIEITLGVLSKLKEKIKDITILVGKEFQILSSDEDVSLETFGEKLKSLAELSLSQLEETSQSEEFKLIKGGMPQDVVEEFELLDYIQNELGLTKKDFEDIKDLLHFNRPLYTFTNMGRLFGMVEIRQGKRVTGKKVLVVDETGVSETGCTTLKYLWTEAGTPKSPNLPTLEKRLNALHRYSKNTLLAKHSKGAPLRGFIAELYRIMEQHTVQAILTRDVTPERIKLAKTYLSMAELTTSEIKELKEHLLRTGGLKTKGKKLVPADFPRLVNGIIEYFDRFHSNITDKNVSYRLIGWWM